MIANLNSRRGIARARRCHVDHVTGSHVLACCRPGAAESLGRTRLSWRHGVVDGSRCLWRHGRRHFVVVGAVVDASAVRQFGRRRLWNDDRLEHSWRQRATLEDSLTRIVRLLFG